MMTSDIKIPWQLASPDEALQPRRYILPWAAGCVTCAQHMPGEMMPPHDPSPRCESGKRQHCTCDICF